MDALAGTERELLAEHFSRQRLLADQVHLDAMAVAVIDRAMNEGADVEVTAELAVDPVQHIEIETRGDAGGVVIGVVECPLVLLEIDADHHAGAFAQNGARALEEFAGLARLEIAKCRARKKAD